MNMITYMSIVGADVAHTLEDKEGVDKISGTIFDLIGD